MIYMLQVLLCTLFHPNFFSFVVDLPFFLRLYISLSVLLLASSLHNYWDGLENVVFSFFFLSVVSSELSPLARERDFSPFHFFFLFGRGRVRKQKHGGDLEPHDQIKHPFIIILTGWF